jgi:hypothetical protein
VVLKRARAFSFALASACAAASVPACNSGITPGDGYDQVLFTFVGNLASNVELPQNTNPKLGVLWNDPFQVGPDVPMPPAWHTSIIQVIDTYGNFFVDVYRPPPPASITRVAAPSGHDTADIAIADVVIFDDRDNDGAFRPTGIHAEMASDDGYLAVTSALLVYVARPFSGPVPAGFPLGDAIRSGYALIDLGCTGTVSTRPMAIGGTFFVPQPSQRLPEIRSCGRTHSP